MEIKDITPVEKIFLNNVSKMRYPHNRNELKRFFKDLRNQFQTYEVIDISTSLLVTTNLGYQYRYSSGTRTWYRQGSY